MKIWSFLANVHHPRVFRGGGESGGGWKLGYGHRNRLRRSFFAKDSSIDIGEDYFIEGGYRIVERGRGYVRVIVLFEEELGWIQEMCRKEKNFFGGHRQIGCLRGGRRTLICSRIRKGESRKLELRLFAPYGRRIVVVPEMVDGEGWIFFADLLYKFLHHGVQKEDILTMKNSFCEEDNMRLRQHSNNLRSAFQFGRPREELGSQLVKPQVDKDTRLPVGGVRNRSFLEAASFPQWKEINMRCHIGS